MFKRIWTLFIVVVLIIVQEMVTFATDNPIIKITTDVFDVDVVVDTKLDERLSLKVFKLVEDSEEPGKYNILNPNNPIHYWQENTSTNVNGLNRYTFDTFSLANTTTTGKYRVVINGTYEKDFSFAHYNDKKLFYEALKTAEETKEAISPANWIQTILKNNYDAGAFAIELGDCDIAKYFEYTGDSVWVRENIDKGIKAIQPNLPQSLTGGATTEEIIEYIKEFELVLAPAMERLLASAELLTSAPAEFADKAEAFSDADILDLELKYFSDTGIKLDPKAVQKRIATLRTSDFNKETIQDTFDTAVLLAMIDKSDYGSVTSALKFYNGRCVTLDTTKTAGFNETQLNKLSDYMKQEATKISTSTDIENSYVECAKKVLEGQNTPNTDKYYPQQSAVSVVVGNTDNESQNEVPQPIVFSDISETPWAYEAIAYLKEKGIVNGKEDGKFYPNDMMTREECVKIIVEAFDIYGDNKAVDFIDIDAERWSYKYITSAYNARIINGVDEKNFLPEGKMTREDLAVIMYRVLKFMQYDFSGQQEIFADEKNISDYALEAIRILGGEKIINGTGNGMYSPKDIVTRAQGAKMVYEVISAQGGRHK